MTTPSIILAELEAKLVGLVLPNTLGDNDGLTVVHTLEDWLVSEMDRRFVVLPVAGPIRTPGRSRCSDRFTLSVRVRYFGDAESKARMVDDVPIIREALKSAAGMTDLISTPEVAAPTYDYGQWAGLNAVGVKFDCALEYHV